MEEPVNSPFAVQDGLKCLLLSAIAVGAISALPTVATAAMPTNPVSDPQFTRLPNGRDLTSISVKGSRLYLAKGTGTAFGASAKAAYAKLKADSQSNPDHRVQWVLMDLDGHQVVDMSLAHNRKIFGASSSKPFVGAALLDKQGGDLSSSQLQLMSDMIVVSSNTAWTNLQTQAGGGNSTKGREVVHTFTQRMGYERTRGFQGYWGTLHGNELTAHESAEFLHDTYKGNYPGAETLWKIMHACRTGSSRGRKYIPSNIYVGGKTGTYDGPTENPETGKTKNPDGSSYRVAVRNHLLVFNIGGRQYALTILADTGSDESAAVLAGGLIREYLGVK